MDTKFFHMSVVQHQARNRILAIKNMEAIRVTEYEEVKEEAIRYYEELFKEKADFTEKHKQMLQKVVTNSVSRAAENVSDYCDRGEGKSSNI